MSSSLRHFSSTELTKEEISEGLVKVEKHRKFVRGTTKPKTITDVLGPGTELHVPKNVTEIAVLGGMPEEHRRRTAVIAPRLNKTLQSGDKTGYQWQISWKNRERWTNPLMGWSSSSDPMSQVKLNFDCQEDAIAYAQKNGFAYELRGRVADANENIPVGTMTYAHNFLKKRTQLEVTDDYEAGKPVMEYFRSGSNQSNWFMPLTYDGTAEVIQHGPKTGPTNHPPKKV
jgi:NADH dehydrogenase (ubiquinone) Fe-S protein 4